MSNLIWPATLPQSPLLAGFSHKLGNNIVRTTMSAGPDKLRRRSTAVADEQNISFSMDNAQRDILIDFYKSDLGGGVKAFDLTDPVSNIVQSYRFRQPPEFAPLGTSDYWRVTCMLELLP